jgi:hypothetical protein
MLRVCSAGEPTAAGSCEQRAQECELAAGLSGSRRCKCDRPGCCTRSRTAGVQTAQSTMHVDRLPGRGREGSAKVDDLTDVQPLPGIFSSGRPCPPNQRDDRCQPVFGD